MKSSCHNNGATKCSVQEVQQVAVMLPKASTSGGDMAGDDDWNTMLSPWE